MATSRICAIPDCGKPHLARGWCTTHWQRWRRLGDPLAGGTEWGAPLKFLREVVMTYEGNDCLPWPFGKTPDGYGLVQIEGAKFLVSRVVCEDAHGQPPTPEHEAAHGCGKGHEACCTKRHLSWKTPKQNSADRIAHGTVIRGESVKTSKLTEANVREIRGLKGCVLQRKIAERFGVNQQTISHIHSGKRWGWLT